MPTNRELYFQLLSDDSKYLNKNIIISLLADASKFDDRMVLYANFDREVVDVERLYTNLELIKKGMPYQYVLGYSYFLGNKIIVNKDVLIPRQETEQLTVDTIVYLKKVFKSDEYPVIADVCTGSGAIACAIEKEIPNAKIYATDISSYALKVAKKNTKNVEMLCGNLLQPLIDNRIKLDVLICNPPYIENINNIDKQVWKYEPHLALVAVPGTKCYEEIFKNADQVMKEHYLMAFEIEEDMEEALIKLMNKYLAGCTYRFHKDIYNKTRFLYIIK
ncbi:MAG: peptide chain release factor N(5)-glutamine methyltransferase [Bacilli bacterium]|nr:peptide chain release factor N(5)-glutamine methyltransferase [Bacilli bacterium]